MKEEIDKRSKSQKKEENPNTVAGMRRILIDAGIKGASRFNKARAEAEIKKLEEKKLKEIELSKSKEELNKPQINSTDSIFVKIEKSQLKNPTFENYYSLVQKFEFNTTPISRIKTLPMFPFPKINTFAFFGYYTSDNRHPYYDSFPFDYIINTKNDTFMGVNLHYLHPSMRWDAIEMIIKGRVNLLPKKCFHQYLYNRLTTVTYVCPTHYIKTAVLLSNENFRVTQNQQKIKSNIIWNL